MPVLIWDSVNRSYTAGVDRGVLYIGGIGYAWNGLTGISEETDDGVNTSTYFDGVRYVLPSNTEDFGLSVDAITYPTQFSLVEGLDGIFDKQSRGSFGFCYRVGYGSGYRLHLVYNAVAEPTNRSYKTLDSSGDPSTFSWDFSTLPEAISAAKPSSHVVIDSNMIAPAALAAIEALLYGTVSTTASLPTIATLVGITGANLLLIITDNGDGTWSASGPDSMVYFTSATTWEINSPSAVYTAIDSYRVSSI